MAVFLGSIAALAVASSTAGATVTNLRLSMFSQAFSESSFSGVTKDTRLSMNSYGFSESSLAPVVTRRMTLSGYSETSSTMGASSAMIGGMSSAATATGRMLIFSPTETLHVSQAVSDILQLWGIESICNAPEFAIARAMADRYRREPFKSVWEVGVKVRT